MRPDPTKFFPLSGMQRPNSFANSTLTLHRYFLTQQAFCTSFPNIFLLCSGGNVRGVNHLSVFLYFIFWVPFVKVFWIRLDILDPIYPEVLDPDSNRIRIRFDLKQDKKDSKNIESGHYQ
jgi:hypothetical protein